MYPCLIITYRYNSCLFPILYTHFYPSLLHTPSILAVAPVMDRKVLDLSILNISFLYTSHTLNSTLSTYIMMPFMVLFIHSPEVILWPNILILSLFLCSHLGTHPYITWDGTASSPTQLSIFSVPIVVVSVTTIQIFSLVSSL